MGNMLPTLLQARSNTLPSMNTTKHWSRSMKVLARTLRRTIRRPCRVSMVKAASLGPLAADQTTTRTRRAQKNGRQSRRVVRVKVVLTRAEATRLLSLTEHGDMTAAQVVSELKRMQVTHANASVAAARAWRPMLESIPEEWP